MREQVNPGALELVVFGRTWSGFRYRTHHAMNEVLEPGYFDGALGVGIRVGDMVEVMAGAGKAVSGTGSVGELGPVTFGSIVVSAIRSANERQRVSTALLSRHDLKGD